MRNQKVSHLKEGFGSRSPGLQHNGQDGEDDDLDSGAPRVPVRPADPVLRIVKIKIIVKLESKVPKSS